MMMLGFGMGGIAMVIGTLVVVGLCVLLIVALFPRSSGANVLGGQAPTPHTPPAPPPQSAVEILKSRYARGEITKEQFEQMRRDVES